MGGESHVGNWRVFPSGLHAEDVHVLALDVEQLRDLVLELLRLAFGQALRFVVPDADEVLVGNSSDAH